MNKFKSGDRVICIVDYDRRERDFIKDQIYTVKDNDSSIFGYILIEKDSNGSTTNGWCVEYFELAYIKEFSDKLEGILNE